MKVNLGPYKNWFGPYQLVKPLKYLGVSEDVRDKIAEYIPTAPFVWLEKMRGKRKEKVVIHRYDAWSADHTLALIIAPLLRTVKEDKHGIPGEFLGEEYNTLTSSKEFWDEKDGGPLHIRADVLFKEAEKKWDETLDHMIWAFEEYVKDDWDEQYWTGEFGDISFEDNGDGTSKMLSSGNRECDLEGRQKHWEKMHNGIKLFAEHFPSLWT
jgi:hypothetical protein